MFPAEKPLFSKLRLSRYVVLVRTATARCHIGSAPAEVSWLASYVQYEQVAKIHVLGADFITVLNCIIVAAYFYGLDSSNRFFA
jgi:hypothetical protein